MGTERLLHAANLEKTLRQDDSRQQTNFPVDAAIASHCSSLDEVVVPDFPIELVDIENAAVQVWIRSVCQVTRYLHSQHLRVLAIESLTASNDRNRRQDEQLGDNCSVLPCPDVVAVC